ncbi:MAG: response regulator transcription factor [Desulfobacterales bacterium]|nr:response regulator transcription factor [Desulfobacterales bacterium]
MEPYRVVLADDHLLFRQGMKRLIEEIPDVEVIGEASDGMELLNLLRKVSPDLVILDISMPNLRGIEAAREIRMLYPRIKILVLTMHKSKEYLYHSISAGAQGYLLKEDSDVELLSAIETIRNGEVYITRSLAGELAEDLSQIYTGKVQILRDPLTTREREILKLIAEGKTNNLIASFLFISVRTVEHHRAKIIEKLKLKKTADLVRYAIAKGIA